MRIYSHAVPSAQFINVFYGVDVNFTLGAHLKPPTDDLKSLPSAYTEDLPDCK